jgi:hypothetical protein
VSYVGCRFVGGVNRIVVGKRDASRSVCFNVVLGNGPLPPNLTLPPGFGLESASAMAFAGCPTRSASGTPASQVTGSVQAVAGGSLPSAVDVDLMLSFAPGSGLPQGEPFQAENVDIQPTCSP